MQKKNLTLKKKMQSECTNLIITKIEGKLTFTTNEPKSTTGLLFNSASILKNVFRRRRSELHLMKRTLSFRISNDFKCSICVPLALTSFFCNSTIAASAQI